MTKLGQIRVLVKVPSETFSRASVSSPPPNDRTNLLGNGANELRDRRFTDKQEGLICGSRCRSALANRSQNSMTPVAALTAGLPRPRAPSGYVPPRNASTGSNELARHEG
jgi:hypothetical protein